MIRNNTWVCDNKTHVIIINFLQKHTPLKKETGQNRIKQILVSQVVLHLFNHLFIHSTNISNSYFVPVSAVAYGNVSQTESMCSQTLQSSERRRKWAMKLICNSLVVSATKKKKKSKANRMKQDCGGRCSIL